MSRWRAKYLVFLKISKLKSNFQCTCFNIFEVQRVGDDHCRDLGQRMQCKIESVVVTCVNLTDLGIEPSLPHQKTKTSTTQPSGSFSLYFVSKSFFT